MIGREYLENFLPVFLQEKLYNNEFSLCEWPVYYFLLIMST